MLNQLDTEMDKTQAQLDNLNKRLKKTLEKVIESTMCTISLRSHSFRFEREIDFALMSFSLLLY